MEKELIGKTIIEANIKKLPKDEYNRDYDDKPILELKMDDGSIFEVISNYGGYTGNSEDEYPRFINVEKIKNKEGDEKNEKE